MLRQNPRLASMSLTSSSGASFAQPDFGGPPVSCTLSTDQLQPLLLGEYGDAVVLGLVGLGSGVLADDDVVGLLGDAAGHIGAERLGAALRFRAGHGGERAREHHRLAGDLRAARLRALEI